MPISSVPQLFPPRTYQSPSFFLSQRTKYGCDGSVSISTSGQLRRRVTRTTKAPVPATERTSPIQGTLKGSVSFRVTPPSPTPASSPAPRNRWTHTLTVSFAPSPTLGLGIARRSSPASLFDRLGARAPTDNVDCLGAALAQSGSPATRRAAPFSSRSPDVGGARCRPSILASRPADLRSVAPEEAEDSAAAVRRVSAGGDDTRRVGRRRVGRPVERGVGEMAVAAGRGEGRRSSCLPPVPHSRHSTAPTMK